MWKFIKRTRYALLNSIKKNTALFFSATASFTALAVLFLAWPIGWAAIPVGIAIGFVVSLLLIHLVHWSCVLRNNGIARDYIEALTEPQEKLYNEPTLLKTMLAEAIPAIPNVLKDLVFEYAANPYPVRTKPKEFEKMLRSIDIDDAGVYKFGSLKEFIHMFSGAFESAPRFRGNKCSLEIREDILRDLIALSFNFPEKVANLERNQYSIDASTPCDILYLAVIISMAFKSESSFRALLDYGKKQDTLFFIKEVLDGLSRNHNNVSLSDDALETFVSIFSEQNFSEQIFDEALNLPEGQGIFKDKLIANSNDRFFTIITEKLHLPPAMFERTPTV